MWWAVTILDDILSEHRRAAQADDRDLDELVARARATPEPRSLRDVLAAPGLAVIAEVKRRSPSAGELAPGLEPATQARAYAAGGAAAVSVLTDGPHFGGSPADVAAVRGAAPGLPVLRKDFTVDARDVADARIMGADAVLLIAAALSDDELVELQWLASDLGLGALVEVHDRAELDRVLGTGARLVGVNQRDLRTFEIDRNRAADLRRSIPEGVVCVAESGIRDRADVPEGYDAVLVGESLVTAADPAAAIRALKGEGGDPS